MPETVLDAHFKGGLREDTRLPVNSEKLIDCNGMKATEFGASKALTIADATNGLTQNWPFPQIFKAEGFTLVLDSDVLYYRKSDGTKQALTVYEDTAGASEKLADTNFDTWDASAATWTLDGTAAEKAAGADEALTDTITSLPAGLYRMSVVVSEVNTTESSADVMWVQIGSSASVSQVPKVGTMEFDVLTTGANTTVSIYGDINAAFRITSATLREIASIADLGFSSTTKPLNLTSFGKIWFLCGETGILMCAPMCGTKGAYSGADFQFPWRIVWFDTTKIGCMASFNSRIYASGFNAADSRYDSAEFIQAFDVFVKKHVGLMYEGFEVDKNVVFYGLWSGGDVNWPFAADLALFGALDSVQSAQFADLFVQGLRDGDMGFFRLPCHDGCLRLVPMGGFLLAYCVDGVYAIRPADDNANLHSVKLISSVGLADKGAVVEANEFHMYLGNNGKLNLISNELQWRDLGYEEFLLTLVTNKATLPPIMLVDTDESEVYVGNSSVAYIRTRSGLGRTWTAVSGLYQSSLSNLAGAAASIAPVSGLARIRLMPIDFGNRNFKSIHDVEVGAWDITNLKARIHYKNDHSETYTASEWHPVIRGGFTIPLISGYEFMFELEFTPGANARIEYLKVNWQIRDHRNFRRQAGRI